jgi:hypothetical protein
MGFMERLPVNVSIVIYSTIKQNSYFRHSEKFCLQGIFPPGHGKIAPDIAPPAPDRRAAAGLAGLALSLLPETRNEELDHEVARAGGG